MNLKQSYARLAPFYDLFIKNATQEARQQSLIHLANQASNVLICGVGTGLDFPFLPPKPNYIGVELSNERLQRALNHPQKPLNFHAVLGDAQKLAFPDAYFDAVVLHLILAVVPDSAACLSEVCRVLKSGGHILIFDKFLRVEQKAPLRKLLNKLMQNRATRLDVVFETVLNTQPKLQLLSDQNALLNGWFRTIHLQKN